jgi:hypothetical protein
MNLDTQRNYMTNLWRGENITEYAGKKLIKVAQRLEVIRRLRGDLSGIIYSDPKTEALVLELIGNLIKHDRYVHSDELQHLLLVKESLKKQIPTQDRDAVMRLIKSAISDILDEYNK